MPTLGSVIDSVRELAFDRFVTPSFFIGSTSPGYTMSISSTDLVINKNGSPVTTLAFSTHNTLKKVFDQLAVSSEKYQLSYSASFRNAEAATSLLQMSLVSIDTPIPVYRSYFFGEEKVRDIMLRYMQMVLGYNCLDIATLDLETEVSEFKCQRPHHMALWVAFFVVDERRLYEMAGEMLGQSTFSFSNQAGMIGVSEEGSTVTVNIGDVFTMQSSPESNYNKNELPNQIGADNVLGDASSFWYRLQLYLRQQLERLFGDYSLRLDTVMNSKMTLEKDRNFYAFYDNYPYTLSPLTREVLSSFQ